MMAVGDRPGFAVSVVTGEDGTTVVQVSGEVDVATAPQLRRTLLDPSLCPGPHVRVDLRQVSFIDSSGIGALVVARAHLLELGGAISVRCLHGPVARTLAITGLDSVLQVVVDPEGPPG